MSRRRRTRDAAAIQKAADALAASLGLLEMCARTARGESPQPHDTQHDTPHDTIRQKPPETADIFSQPGPLTVAYGMGTDSTAMLIEMVRRGIRPDVITFADTGAEHPRTYAYLPIINEYLARHGFPLVTVVRYVPGKPKNGQYYTISGNCLVNKTLPSLAFGYKKCSLKWKAEPQEKYLTQYWQPGIEAKAAGVPLRRLIGYDAGPKDSKRGAVNENPDFSYGYPLRLWNIDREECKAIIEAAGLPQPGKSACIMCPSTKPDELAELARDYPDLAARAIAIEDNAREKLTKIAGLWRKPCKGTRKGSVKHSGNWREYLESLGLLPDIRPEHYREEPPTLSTPAAWDKYPYLHVLTYQPAEELAHPIAV